MGEKYFYGMRLRGFSPGCQPKEGLVGLASEDEIKRFRAEKFHDVIVYNRELTEKELHDYELDWVGFSAKLTRNSILTEDDITKFNRGKNGDDLIQISETGEGEACIIEVPDWTNYGL